MKWSLPDAAAPLNAGGQSAQACEPALPPALPSLASTQGAAGDADASLRTAAWQKPFHPKAYARAGGMMILAAAGFWALLRTAGVGTFPLVLAAFAALTLYFMGPIVALSVYLTTTFFGALALPGLPLTGNQMVGLLALGSWGLWLARGRLSWPGGWLIWLLAAAAVYYMLNAYLGQGRETAAASARYVFLCAVMTLVLLTSLRRPEHWSLWLWLILGISAAIAAVGAAEFVLGRDFFPQGKARAAVAAIVPVAKRRINGVSQNAIMFAYNNLWAVGLGFYLAIEARRAWTRLLALALTVFLILTALLTMNRQTPLILLLMLGAGTLVFRHRLVRPLAIGLVALGLLAAPFAAAQLTKRFGETGKMVKDPSYALRHDKFIVMKEMVRQNPWFGIGVGSFPEVWSNYLTDELWFLYQTKPRIHYPDLGYMQMLSESGIVGFALEWAILLAGMWMLWRRRARALGSGSRASANLCAALMVLWVHLLAAQLLQDVFFFARTWWLFAMTAVICARPDEEVVFSRPGESGEIETIREIEMRKAPGASREFETHEGPETRGDA